MTETIDVTTTFLEMILPCKKTKVASPKNTEIVFKKEISSEDYMKLYLSVGEPWLWYERINCSTQEIHSLISPPHVSIFQIEKGGKIAGYCELNESPEKQIQILYFGLKQDFIGQGLGGYFLDWIIGFATKRDCKRLWLHTCSLDHPRALPSYQKAGFTVFRQETNPIPIPKSVLQKANSKVKSPL